METMRLLLREEGRNGTQVQAQEVDGKEWGWNARGEWL